MNTCLAKLNTKNLPKILQGFDLAVLKLGSSLRVTRWVKPLTTLHAVSTKDSNYDDYLKDQALYTAGMGVCEEGTESERSFFSEKVAQYQDLFCVQKWRSRGEPPS